VGRVGSPGASRRSFLSARTAIVPGRTLLLIAETLDQQQVSSHNHLG
jgi:hypothetical protein